MTDTQQNSVLSAFLDLISTDTLPHLGPEVRSGLRSANELVTAVEHFCGTHSLDQGQEELLKSAALLWHDDLEASHTFSQDIKTSDGSFLHGIMHRREPDSSNAKYWFRLVGNHSSFPALASTVAAFAESKGKSAETASLVSGGDWDPFAFVDACSRAMQGNRDSETYTFLQELQQLELQALLREILQNSQ